MHRPIEEGVRPCSVVEFQHAFPEWPAALLGVSIRGSDNTHFAISASLLSKRRISCLMADTSSSLAASALSYVVRTHSSSDHIRMNVRIYNYVSPLFHEYIYVCTYTQHQKDI